jgi:transcriptional antiterminator RfaH
MQQWFALRVKSRFEKIVALAAHQKGFEEFLPLYHCRHEWSDRSKEVDLPLFPGYVFCRVEAEHRFPLLTIPGVLHMVGVGKTPVAMDDGEIEAIQSAVESGLPVEPWPFQEDGQRVRLGDGPLDGTQGFLVEGEEAQRVVVNLSALKQAVAVEVDRDWVEPVDAGTPNPMVEPQRPASGEMR